MQNPSALRKRLFAVVMVAATAVGPVFAVPPVQAKNRTMETPVSFGHLTLSNAFARAMLPGQPAGSGYVTIANDGDEDEVFLGASSLLAGRVELHAMEMDGDVMRMRPVEDGLVIRSGEAVALAPGHYHLMFMDMPSPFRTGENVPVTLSFRNAGEISILLPVKPVGAVDASTGSY